MLGALLVVVGPALDEHGLDHVVGGSQVLQQLGRQMSAAAPIPEMMVGIDDRPVGIDRVLPAQRESVEPVELHQVLLSASASDGAGSPAPWAIYSNKWH